MRILEEAHCLLYNLYSIQQYRISSKCGLEVYNNSKINFLWPSNYLCGVLTGFFLRFLIQIRKKINPSFILLEFKASSFSRSYFLIGEQSYASGKQNDCIHLTSLKQLKSSNIIYKSSNALTIFLFSNSAKSVVSKSDRLKKSFKIVHK